MRDATTSPAAFTSKLTSTQPSRPRMSASCGYSGWTILMSLGATAGTGSGALSVTAAVSAGAFAASSTTGALPDSLASAGAGVMGDVCSVLTGASESIGRTFGTRTAGCDGWFWVGNGWLVGATGAFFTCA